MSRKTFRQFNTYGAKLGGELLQKALTTLTGSGEALIREWWENEISNLVIHLQPEFAMLDPKRIGSKKYNFRRLTEQGNGGGVMGEEASTPVVDDVWEDETLVLKIIRRKLRVSGFMEVATEEADYDAMALQIEQSVRGHVQQLMFYIHRGNKGANALEHDGLDFMMKTNRFNSFSAGVPQIPTNLDFLDELIDSTTIEGASQHKRVFIMSPQMLSRISKLLTNVRNQQTSGAITRTEIEGGWKLFAYNEVPIIQSTFVGNKKSGVMGTIAGVGSDPSDQNLSNGTYNVVVTKLTLRGESAASPEVVTVLGGGTNTQQVAISWSNEADALSYKIYLSEGAGGLQNTVLHDWIPANTYAADGTINGRVLGVIITSQTPDANVIPTQLQSDLAPSIVSGVNSEEVILWNLDKTQGLGDYVYVNKPGSRVNGLVALEDLDKDDDRSTMLLKTYPALAERFEATSARHRGLLPK